MNMCDVLINSSLRLYVIGQIMFRENMGWEIDNKGFRGFERQVCKLEKRVKDTGGFLSAKHTLESLGWRQRQRQRQAAAAVNEC